MGRDFSSKSRPIPKEWAGIESSQTSPKWARCPDESIIIVMTMLRAKRLQDASRISLFFAIQPTESQGTKLSRVRRRQLGAQGAGLAWSGSGSHRHSPAYSSYSLEASGTIGTRQERSGFRKTLCSEPFRKSIRIISKLLDASGIGRRSYGCEVIPQIAYYALIGERRTLPC
ncbi:hypothetical protein GUJ93_ZPchr0014g46745 [Zizania palustris]|uniref:Uncharacterized protein n=1 Tax=Zizania palustris TaxID=103762 RepID=A0A8J5TKU5_ZIZPA|nr:hypothetical protein GUJ93_ZPchr0014g46745 [Zizania palustris]